MSLKVLDPGLQLLLVGKPAFGLRNQGIPWGGPADWVSMAISNSLMGNPYDTPAMEVCLAGPTLEARENTAVGIFGTRFRMELDHKPIKSSNTIFLKKGQTLRLLDCESNTRAYISTIGGFECSQTSLKKNHLAKCAASICGIRFVPTDCEYYPDASTIRVTAGPEAHLFRDHALHSVPFTVDQSSNRMGIRLSGAPLAVPKGEMLSEPVCPGTIQVAKNGNLLLLGVEGQTIGGYPRIAQVIRSDLHKMGQLRPGQKVSFEYVSLEQAEILWDRLQAELGAFCLRLSVASADFL